MPWQSIPPEESLPFCERGAVFPISEVRLLEKQTSPPDYLTEAELITLMEKHGIGRKLLRYLCVLFCSLKLGRQRSRNGSNSYFPLLIQRLVNVRPNGRKVWAEVCERERAIPVEAVYFYFIWVNGNSPLVSEKSREVLWRSWGTWGIGGEPSPYLWCLQCTPMYFVP